MTETRLTSEVCRKDFDVSKVAAKVQRHPELLSTLITGLNDSRATVRYGCDKVLRRLSSLSPALLYPHFDVFASRIDSDKTFLKWGAIFILANLTTVDSSGKFEKIWDSYYAPITGPSLITATNIIKGSAIIGCRQPATADRVVKELLRVEGARYQTAECLNIALGQVIKTFDAIFNGVTNKEELRVLANRLRKNTRASTRNAAEKFLAKHGVGVG